MKFPFFSSAPAHDIDGRRRSPGFTPLDVFSPEAETVDLPRSRDDSSWADDIVLAEKTRDAALGAVELARAGGRVPARALAQTQAQAPASVPASTARPQAKLTAVPKRAPIPEQRPSAPADPLSAEPVSPQPASRMRPLEARRSEPDAPARAAPSSASTKTPPRPDSTAAGAAVAPAEGTIGAILVASKRISADDARRVLAEQSVSSAPFGEIAVRMGVASPADIQFALSQQFSMPCLQDGSVALDSEIIAAFDPTHDVVERLRGLRNEIAQRALYATPPLRSIAIIGVERRVGRSYIVANLATVFAQLGARTLLIDADLVNPRLHQLFRLPNRAGLSSILAGRANLSAVCPVQGMPGFAVLPAGPTPPNPHDLIARPLLGHFLRRCEQDFDVVLIDTPPWSLGSSARMAASAAGAAVLVVQAGQTMAYGAVEATREVTGVGTKLIGVVVNRP